VRSFAQLALVAAALAFAGGAAAGPDKKKPPAAATKLTPEEEKARAKFEEGIGLSDAGKWAEALDAFRESDALVPTAGARYNIAITLRALGRYIEAREQALDIVARASELKAKPALLDDVQKLLRELEGTTAFVRIRVKPKRATVEIDGSPAHAGEDGRIELDPGKHVFVVKAKGHETTTVARELEAGESELALSAPKRKRAAQPAPTPVYAEWWLWTTVGAAAATTAAVVAVVFVTTREDEPGAEPPASTVGVIPVSLFRF
jgi:hypothetical protein